MKKLAVAVALALTTLLVCASLFATVPINKKHSGLERGGAKINCAYCHTKHKVEKKKQDMDALKKKPFCAGAGCH